MTSRPLRQPTLRPSGFSMMGAMRELTMKPQQQADRSRCDHAQRNNRLYCWSPRKEFLFICQHPPLLSLRA